MDRESTKHEANQWLEAWAGRWGIDLEPWGQVGPGEYRKGLLRQVRCGQWLPEESQILTVLGYLEGAY
jgi:hypothetical protein